MSSARIISSLSLLFIISCTSLGPSTVTKDRFDYVSAISKSREQQMLLNIVKIRYAEIPLFLDVGQVVAGYNFSVGAGASASGSAAVSNIYGLSANGSYLERPTITYSPVVGKRFEELLMKPITPATILFLVEAGWSADSVLRLTLDSVNGHRNFSALSWRKSETESQFEQFVEVFKTLQNVGALGIRISKGEGGAYATQISIQSNNLDEEQLAQLALFKSNLDLIPDSERFNVVYGHQSKQKQDINILTRSLLQILLEQSAGVDIPQSDIDRVLKVNKDNLVNAPMLQIKSGDSQPNSAFIKVFYRGHWFWVEDTDLRSKIIFGYLILLSNLAEGGGQHLQPVISIQG